MLLSMKRIVFAATALAPLLLACSGDGPTWPTSHIMYGEWVGEINYHYNGDRTATQGLSLSAVCQLVTDGVNATPGEGARIELQELTDTTIRFRSGPSDSGFTYVGERRGNVMMGETRYDLDEAYSADWRFEKVSDVASCIPMPPPPLPDSTCIPGKWELRFTNHPHPEDEDFLSFAEGGTGFIVSEEFCFGTIWQVRDYELWFETADRIFRSEFSCIGNDLVFADSQDTLIYVRIDAIPPCDRFIPWP
jgi:hypothetical protein